MTTEPKPPLTPDEKKNRVITWLTNHHLCFGGGYEHGYTTHAGRLFVAELNYGKDCAQTKIDVYALERLPEWYDRAAAYMADNAKEAGEEIESWPEFETGDWGEWSAAFYETDPPMIVEN